MASSSPSSDQPERLGFLLLPRFSMMAFVNAVEPLRAANRLAGRELYRWEILSRDGGPLTASNDMTLVADRGLIDAPAYSMVVVCASFDPERYYDGRMRDWLRRAARTGADLGGVDGGSFILARTGLLDGHRATTHWESLDSFREQFPRVEVEAGLFVFDRNRITCAGGTAGLDMMLHFIARRHGQRLAAAISEQFIHAEIRGPQERQRMAPALRQGIARSGLGPVIARMEANLEDPLSAEALAAAADLSLRQLERSFKRHLNSTPNRYYLDLRLQRARSLLQYSNLSVLEIGIACGFGSAAHFSRSYRAWSGKPPRADRGSRPAGIVPTLR